MYTWFKNLNAAPRLMLSFGLVLALTASVCAVGLIQLRTSNQSIDELYQKDLLGLSYVDDMAINRMSTSRSGRDAMLNIHDPKVVSADRKLVLEGLAAIHSDLDQADRLFYLAEGKADLAETRAAYPDYQRAYITLLDRVSSGDLDGANLELGEITKVGLKLYGGIDRARKLKVVLSKKKFEASAQAYQTSLILMLSTTAAALLFGTLLSVIIARSVSVPLQSTVEFVLQIAEGDLTAFLDVRTSEELGRMAEALNGAIRKIRHTLQEASENARSASTLSEELAGSCEVIASGSQTQAASLEETAASLEEITAAIRQSAENAQLATQLASGSKDTAETGSVVVADAITAMDEINTASAKIADIISTIDEIAFQTNLLAVNAAVEAARAGDEGRGFAVVASEVRVLAQRTTAAAKEIKLLIQDSLRKVERGSSLVDRCGETLQGIVGSVRRVTDLVSQISAAATEQSLGIEQIGTAMTQIDQVTQSNSLQTEVSSATARSLSNQSSDLLRLLETFTVSEADAGNRLLANSKPFHPAPVSVRSKQSTASFRLAERPTIRR